MEIFKTKIEIPPQSVGFLSLFKNRIPLSFFIRYANNIPKKNSRLRPNNVLPIINFKGDKNPFGFPLYPCNPTPIPHPKRKKPIKNRMQYCQLFLSNKNRKGAKT